MSATPSMTGYGALAPNLSASYYVYPPPLFGWLDDPFFGMQPPVVSFAPWTRSRMYVPVGGPNGGTADGAEPGRRTDGRRDGGRSAPGGYRYGGRANPNAGRGPPGAGPWGAADPSAVGPPGAGPHRPAPWSRRR